MKILRGLAEFLTLVMLNIVTIKWAISTALQISNLSGWEAVGEGLVFILAVAVCLAALWFTGFVVSGEIKAED